MTTKPPMPATSQKVSLKYPVNWQGKQINVLTLRAPKVKDLLVVSDAGNDAAQEIAMFANLAEVEPEMLHEMHLADYQKLQKAYRDFLS